MTARRVVEEETREWRRPVGQQANKTAIRKERRGPALQHVCQAETVQRSACGCRECGTRTEQAREQQQDGDVAQWS
jgi:hypothetical protein